MKSLYVNKILLFLFCLLIFVYFLPEISLYTQILLTNKSFTYQVFPKRIIPTSQHNYSTQIKLDSKKYDLSKSYIELLSSKYLKTQNEESYVTFLEKYQVYSTIYLNLNGENVTSNNGIVTVKDNTDIPEGFSVIAKIHLFTYDGKENFDAQAFSVTNTMTNFLFLRLSYLIQYIFWFYAIFGVFVIKSKWATIYDSKTKKPLSGVITRIYSGGKLSNTIVTNLNGIIDLRLNKGIYKIDVLKPVYTFPSKQTPLTIDGVYKNLYYGEEIKIEKDNSRLKLNIPLDPNGVPLKTSILKLVTSTALATLDNFNSYFLAAIIIGQFIIWPTFYDTWIFGFVGLSLFGLRYTLRKLRKNKKGIVIDEKGNRIPNIKLNVYDFEWNKIAATTETNEMGEYELLLLPNNYYFKIVNPEWELTEADVDGKLTIKGKIYEQVMYINDTVKIHANSK